MQAIQPAHIFQLGRKCLAIFLSASLLTLGIPITFLPRNPLFQSSFPSSLARFDTWVAGLKQHTLYFTQPNKSQLFENGVMHHYFGPSSLTDLLSTDDLAAERAKAERHDIAFVDLGGVQCSRTGPSIDLGASNNLSIPSL